jgi:membrane protease YdiL (CAAX protease family)
MQPAAGIIPREAPVFGFLDLFLVFLAALFLVSIVPALAVFGAHTLPRYASVPLRTLAKDPVILLPGQALAYLLLVAFIHMLMIARHGRTLAEAIPFAWPRERWITLVGAGIALAFAILVIGHFLPIPKQLPIDDFFKTRAAAFAMLAFAVLVAPLVEELFFRGLLYPVLNRSMRTLWARIGSMFGGSGEQFQSIGVAAALALTSLGFALLHASQLALAWAPLLSLFLVGLALTLVRARFQSVAASTLVHMTYNATLLGILYLQTGGFRHMDALTR